MVVLTTRRFRPGGAQPITRSALFQAAACGAGSGGSWGACGGDSGLGGVGTFSLRIIDSFITRVEWTKSLPAAQELRSANFAGSCRTFRGECRTADTPLLLHRSTGGFGHHVMPRAAWTDAAVRSNRQIGPVGLETPVGISSRVDAAFGGCAHVTERTGFLAGTLLARTGARFRERPADLRLQPAEGIAQIRGPGQRPGVVQFARKTH